MPKLERSYPAATMATFANRIKTMGFAQGFVLCMGVNLVATTAATVYLRTVGLKDYGGGSIGQPRTTTVSRVATLFQPLFSPRKLSNRLSVSRTLAGGVGGEHASDAHFAEVQPDPALWRQVVGHQELIKN